MTSFKDEVIREQSCTYLCEEGAKLLSHGDILKINSASDLNYYTQP